MKTRSIALIALFVISWAASVETRAATARTYVSSTGNDDSNCSITAPCRTFAEAISKTSAGGELTALDSGAYGVITIDKSITIQAAPGVLASVGSAGTATAVQINGPGVVVLRNLYITRGRVSGGQATGILASFFTTLHIESCVVTGFGEYGIYRPRIFAPANLYKLFIKDTIIRNNGTGIHLSDVTASIDRTRFENNGTGVSVGVVSGGLTLRDCLLAGNSDNGLKIQYDSSTTIESLPTSVESCVVTNNGTGIEVGGSSFGLPFTPFIVFVSNTMISGNQIGLAGEGHIRSFGNNRLANNRTNGSFTHTLLQQ